MERNYLLIVYNKVLGNFERRYFDTLENMNKYIKEEIKGNKHKSVVHKYKIEEVI